MRNPSGIILLVWVLGTGCAGVAHRVAQITEGTAYLSTACDAGSTRWAIHRGSFVETNPVMGMHPDDATLAGYFGIVESGIWFANRLMPTWARIVFNVAVTAIEVRAERGNYAVGTATCGIGSR